MSLLQYTSNEMYSATELVRKSKFIFDKLNKNEIEKAIILRDGKPGFILMDFSNYELLINEYLKLKELSKNNNTQQIKKESIHVNKSIELNDTLDEINSTKLENELEEIDKFDLDFDIEKGNDEKVEPLKEFWD